MANEKATIKNRSVVSSHPVIPNDHFGKCMTDVHARCLALAEAIGNHDFEGVQLIAREAVRGWIAGRAACRRLLAGTKQPSPYAESARELLELRYMDLLELFLNATATIAVPAMEKTLRDLRATLTAANAQPLIAT
jgi:hypothetical protein